MKGYRNVWIPEDLAKKLERYLEEERPQERYMIHLVPKLLEIGMRVIHQGEYLETKNKR
jgi:hypothetical protein